MIVPPFDVIPPGEIFIRLGQFRAVTGTNARARLNVFDSMERYRVTESFERDFNFSIHARNDVPRRSAFETPRIDRTATGTAESPTRVSARAKRARTKTATTRTATLIHFTYVNEPSDAKRLTSRVNGCTARKRDPSRTRRTWLRTRLVEVHLATTDQLEITTRSVVIVTLAPRAANYRVRIRYQRFRDT